MPCLYFYWGYGRELGWDGSRGIWKTTLVPVSNQYKCNEISLTLSKPDNYTVHFEVFSIGKTVCPLSALEGVDAVELDQEMDPRH